MTENKQYVTPNGTVRVTLDRDGPPVLVIRRMVQDVEVALKLEFRDPDRAKAEKNAQAAYDKITYEDALHFMADILGDF